MSEYPKCGAKLEETYLECRGEMKMEKHLTCQGVLLPCERPAKNMVYRGEQLIDAKPLGQEKYWRCSLCGRIVE